MRPYYYLGRNWALTTLSTGQPFYVNTDDRGLTPWIILGGNWGSIDELFQSYVQPGMTILDVGANLGYYTITLAALIGPTGHLHAFEPNPELAPFVRENIAINGYSRRCTFHDVAAGDRAGVAALTFDPTFLGGGSLHPMPDPALRTVDIRVETLDHMLASVGRVDLIKIDAEGHEPAILEGAAQLIQRSPECAYLLEVIPDAWRKHDAIDRYFRPLADGKDVFGVTDTGTLTEVRVDDILQYAEDQPDHFSDFFVCPTSARERVRTRPRCFLGSDLQTEVGLRNDGDICISSGRVGYAVFGPYISLSAGRYQIDLWFSPETKLGGSTIDTCTDAGGRLIKAFPAGTTHMNSEGRVQFELMTPVDLHGFEVRLYVNGDCEGRFLKLELRRVPS